MSRASEWLDGYLKAWESNDPDDVRAIFTDDAEYWFRPDDPDPVRGIDAIIEGWPEDEGTHPTYGFDVLIEDERLGIIKGHVEYPGQQSYHNIWEVWFAPDGRAQRFVEWFMVPRKHSAPAEGAPGE
ncbi:nuclear transport factor 2 family protein [Microbacterium sp.]|uniref:nuclear transport factor 2 family protein n=1 Tax=Microbacterium sp. TaxID=51671 RepID=UPI001AD392D8|nr:nuclear transport factor 2 family protein [Microbacterium sp.]MBN9179303.1 nuclear transport factor 2 family protein [Microbacterium sp.]MBN9189607.1 nuclear transport factor 2 family protein [Microbacterium sp.]MBN9191986.1 nuclear transport factor 2 family protein [Microbacterium sp.]